jgi:hypothetical protein
MPAASDLMSMMFGEGLMDPIAVEVARKSTQ